MSLEQLVSQLPPERKPEKRVLTLLLCGDDDQLLEGLHAQLGGYCNASPAPPGTAGAATEMPAPAVFEQPIEEMAESGSDEMGGFKLPGLVKSARSMLGSLGSSLADLNKDFANMIGLTDTDTGSDGKPGQVYGIRAKNMLRVCTRIVRSPTGKKQEWTVVLVWVKTPVPGYEGWKRVLRCVCSPARFPNAVVWICRRDQPIYNQEEETENARVLKRLNEHVPVVQMVANPQEQGIQIVEVDGQRLRPEADGLSLVLISTGVAYLTAKEMSSRRLAQQLKRKKVVRKVIRDSAFGSALGVLMPIPVLDAGTIMVVEIRMVNAITDKYAELAPSQDLAAVQKRVRLLMAPGVLALLPLQRIKLLPTGGPLINMSANALLTFTLGVATAEVFERLVEHQMLFDDTIGRLLKREMDIVRDQASALLAGAKAFAGDQSRMVLDIGKAQKKRFLKSKSATKLIQDEPIPASPQAAAMTSF
jgi:uncharacterized protein (DUF697 family)